MNRIALSIGDLNIYWYSVFISVGALIGFIFLLKEAKKQKVSKDFIIDIVLYSLPIGIIGARLYYVLFNFSYYSKNLIEIIQINKGGLAIHGGLIFGLGFAYFYAKKRGYNPIKVLDMSAISILIGQIFGRWGNFINQEAHGPRVSLEFLQKLHLPNFIIEGMKINGYYYHPTFLYESVWNLIGFIFLLFYRRNKEIKLGEMTLIYLMWYSFGRFFIEYLRTDSLMLGNIKIAMLISALLFISCLIGLVIVKNKSKSLYNKEENK